MNRPPAFQLYVKDLLTSRKIAVMNLAQVGAYILLLAACWDSDDCSLPDDEKTLAALSRMGEQWGTDASAPVRACFVPHPKHPDHLTNTRLLAEFHSLLKFRRAKQRAGHIGGVNSGVTRRNVRRDDTEADLKHGFDSASSKTEAKHTSSSSSSSSSSKEKKEKTPPAVDIDFEDVWKSYPMRNGKRVGRPEALRKWVEVNEDDRKLVRLAVRNYANSELVMKGIGIKDLHRWLRSGKDDEPWRDWIEPEKLSKPLSNGHGALSTCTKRIQGPDDRFLRQCGQPASPESRPLEPRCAEHVTGSVEPKGNVHVAH